MRSWMLVLIALVAACGPGSPSPDPQEDAGMDRQPIDEVLAANAERLMAMEGIQGIAVGETDEGEPCLLVLATVPAEQLAPALGDSLGGWPLRIRSGDEIRPMD